MTDPMSDTQPVQPFSDPVPLTPTIDPEASGRRRGCGSQILVGGVLLLFALLIVGLSAAAGYTTGQREASRGMIATRAAAVDEQLQLVPADIESGNLVLLAARIQWLATQTPGVNGLNGLQATATALYMGSLPTPTPTITPTFPAAPTSDAQQIVVPTPDNGSGYDLPAIYAQAQSALASSQWADAIDLLDVISAADPSFESAEVRRLLGQALNAYAEELYQANQPAAANLIVGRAEELGMLAEGLSYERYAAELYLTARGSVGTGSQTAVNALQELINLGSAGRYYNQATQLLYSAYISQGDSFVGQGNPCGAIGPYQRATTVLASGPANGKLSSAQASCTAMSMATVDPNWMLTPGAQQPVAPIGVPGS